MKINLKYLALATSIASVMSGASAQAANAFNTPQDIILHFQNPGGSSGSASTVMSSLGTITSLRDAAPGYTPLLNIGGTLSATFGSTWFEETTLFMGAAGFFGTSTTSTTLFPGAGGDPNRTIYVTKARASIGTVGFQNSSTPTLANDTAATNTATNINSMNGVHENTNTTQTAVNTTTVSNVDNQNLFLSPGVQGTAYGNINGGIQGSFASGSYGTFGSAGSVELALDIFRIQARNDIAGQYGFGAANLTGEFIGTITINSAGDVGFTNAVPEPSTVGLVGLGLAGFIARRRRPANVIA